jgi:hypothetical protein
MNFSCHKIQIVEIICATKCLVFLDKVAKLVMGITRTRPGWLKPKKALSGMLKSLPSKD